MQVGKYLHISVLDNVLGLILILHQLLGQVVGPLAGPVIKLGDGLLVALL